VVPFNRAGHLRPAPSSDQARVPTTHAGPHSRSHDWLCHARPGAGCADGQPATPCRTSSTVNFPLTHPSRRTHQRELAHRRLPRASGLTQHQPGTERCRPVSDWIPGIPSGAYCRAITVRDRCGVRRRRQARRSDRTHRKRCGGQARQTTCDLGAGDQDRTGALPFTRSRAHCSVRSTCTNSSTQ
jgi:hypothetical protein